MRHLVFLRVLFFLPVFFRLTAGYAQGVDPEPRTLSHAQITALFNDSVKSVYKIKYPIYQVYKYADRSGQYVCVLMESNDSIVKNEAGKYDTSNHFIRALDLKVDNGTYDPR